MFIWFFFFFWLFHQLKSMFSFFNLEDIKKIPCCSLFTSHYLPICFYFVFVCSTSIQLIACIEKHFSFNLLNCLETRGWSVYFSYLMLAQNTDFFFFFWIQVFVETIKCPL